MPSLKDASKYLSLSDAINTLKAELLKADAAAKAGGTALFEFTECEIELSLAFEPKLGAGFDVGFVKVETGATVKGAHKVKVKYKALKPVVAEARVPGEAPRVLEDAKPTAKQPPQGGKAK